MNSPRVSLILPVFNAEEFLPQLLDSLRVQTWNDYEILAVDDGSTDNSLKILQQEALLNPKLRVFSQKNGGVSAARNLALAEATGKWIAFIDGDDWMDPNALATWISYAEENALDLLQGNGFSFSGPAPGGKEQKPLLTKQPWGEILPGRKWIPGAVESGEWPHYVWLQLVRRNLLLHKNIHFQEGMVHEDILWTLDVALAADRMGFCSTPLIGYRRNRGSIMGSRTPEAIERRAHAYLTILETLSGAAAKVDSDYRLHRALHSQINLQSGHLLGLFRSGMLSRDQKRRIARAYFARGLGFAPFRGAEKFNTYWRALRCWVTIWRAHW